jgi:autophagy-related protein 9
MAPYILCISLPNSAREILLFIRSHTLDIPHAGSVCRFAEFDFKRYGNDPKMEASFVNFKTNHPKWVGQQEGEALMQRLGRFKEEEMEKSMRLGDTMYASHMMSMSHQLMQSQAIHTALGHGFGANGMPFTPTHDNQFYWLEKLHQQGGLGDLPPLSPSEFDETKEHF